MALMVNCLIITKSGREPRKLLRLQCALLILITTFKTMKTGRKLIKLQVPQNASIRCGLTISSTILKIRRTSSKINSLWQSSSTSSYIIGTWLHTHQNIQRMTIFGYFWTTFMKMFPQKLAIRSSLMISATIGMKKPNLKKNLSQLEELRFLHTTKLLQKFIFSNRSSRIRWESTQKIVTISYTNHFQILSKCGSSTISLLNLNKEGHLMWMTSTGWPEIMPRSVTFLQKSRCVTSPI